MGGRKTPVAERILVSSLGTADYREAEYYLPEEPERRVRTRFAPVATARLCAARVSRALLLLTEAAERKWGAALKAELASEGIEAEVARVPEVREAADLYAPLGVLAERVPVASAVVLDVTYGYRHLPFLYVASLAYLTGLRGVRVEAARYGALEMAHGGRVPLVDLGGMLWLLEWYRAAARARETGDWRALARMARQEVAALFRPPVGDPCAARALGAVRDGLERLGEALALGLPLESGMAAARAVKAVRDLPQGPRAMPLLLAVSALEEAIRALAIEDGEATQKKADLRLHRAELQRQGRLAAFYAERGDAQKALLVLREAVVSAALLGGRDELRGVEWLDYGARRKPAEAALNAAGERLRRAIAGGAEGRVAALWDSIRDHRNRLAHAGMAVENTAPPSPHKLCGLIRSFEELLREGAFSRLLVGGSERVLLLPLGLSPGVLYSALRALQPDRAILLTSADGARWVGEALRRAGCPELPVEIVVLADPWRSVQLPSEAAAALLAAVPVARELVVSVTGGTTLLQHHVERLAAEAERLGLRVRRFAFIDERGVVEQRREPWVAAPAVELQPGGCAQPAGGR